MSKSIAGGGNNVTNFPVKWRQVSGKILSGTLLGSNNPTLTVLIPAFPIKEYAFAISDEIMTSIVMPLDYKTGTNAYFHLHFTTSGTDTNTVKWQIYLGGAYVDGSFTGVSAAFTLEDTPSGVARTNYKIEWSTPISSTVLQEDMYFTVLVRRITNGGTDNTDDVFGLSADISYQSQNIGSTNKDYPYN